MRDGEHVSGKLRTHIDPVVNLFNWHHKNMAIGKGVDA
jgi:hypothetical protein